MYQYFLTDTGGYSEGEGIVPEPGWVEVSEVDFGAFVAATQADIEAAVEAQELAAQAAAQADAQAVYDDLVGNHPIAALILAQRIAPDFTP